jgi:hypothetical protein
MTKGKEVMRHCGTLCMVDKIRIAIVVTRQDQKCYRRTWENDCGEKKTEKGVDR